MFGFGKSSRTADYVELSDLGNAAADESGICSRRNVKGRRLALWTAAYAITFNLLFIVIIFRISTAPSSHARTSAGQPVLLISIDGFRADYLSRNLTPTLTRMINNGISAEYMTPSFPSKTFPNHYSIVTGLYPESHGIVDNVFFAPELAFNFSYHNAASNSDGRFWLGEPVS